MKTKLIAMAGAVLAVAGMTSCDLDLEPQDYYGGGSFWRTAEQAEVYLHGLHTNLRGQYWNHTLVFGEYRGGHYVLQNCIDGSGTTAGDIFAQNFDESHTGVSNFGNYYGCITNVNSFIKNVTEHNDVMGIEEGRRNYMLGIAHGLRAFYYFDLYRLYASVPLRLGIEVIEGELDPNKLYMPKAPAADVLAQIKDDLKKSMDYFDASGKANNLNPYGWGAKSYWSKAATECLAAEVYLWNCKVAIDPATQKYQVNAPATVNTADLAYAKERLNSVMSNYGLSMQKSFGKVHDATNKSNSEIIFTIRFAEGEATNSNQQYVYSSTTGMAKDIAFYLDGRRFNDDPLGVAVGATGGPQRNEYKFELYKKFDDADTRRDETFIAVYTVDPDTDEKTYGTFVKKNCGIINSANKRTWIGDYVYYRLPWVYLTMAEIANLEGNNADVEKYINMVRERAYGAAWDKETYGFTANDFTKNELAILAEKDKEFVMEGQRWWDVVRMSLGKGGKHLVFCKEGAIEYGFKPDGEVLPIINEADAYKVLWPINKGVIDNDPMIEQTPGYKKAGEA